MSKGSGGVIVFVVVIYILAIGYLAYALGLTSNAWAVSTLTSVHLPGIFAALDVVAWIFGCLGSFFAIMTYSITGNEIPIWLSTFGFLPVGLMMGWMILELARG